MTQLVSRSTRRSCAAALGAIAAPSPVPVLGARAPSTRLDQARRTRRRAQRRARPTRPTSSRTPTGAVVELRQQRRSPTPRPSSGARRAGPGALPARTARRATAPRPTACPANGTSGAFPNLVGLGPATIDFWIESGRMPAADPRAVQANRRAAAPRRTTRPWRSRRGSTRSARATPTSPSSTSPSANVSDGAALFALNCAACHTIEGDGDALAAQHLRAVAAQHPRRPRSPRRSAPVRATCRASPAT